MRHVNALRASCAYNEYAVSIGGRHEHPRKIAQAMEASVRYLGRCSIRPMTHLQQFFPMRSGR
jgi:hypothetical protein